MKFIFFLLIFCAWKSPIYSQSTNTNGKKLPIDTSVLGKWAHLFGPLISNDGNFVSYSIFGLPAGSRTLVLQNTNGTWKKEISGGKFLFFSHDNKEFVYQVQDTLYFQPLLGNEPRYIANIDSYKSPEEGDGEWIAYQLKSEVKGLVLLNVVTSEELRFPSVTDYSFDHLGKTLLLKTLSGEPDKGVISLQWVNLLKYKTDTIWSAGQSERRDVDIADCCFDETGTQLAFIENNQNRNQTFNTIWHFVDGSRKAALLVDENTSGIDSGYLITGNLQFSANGRWIFFNLRQSLETLTASPDGVMVNIWSYKDAILQPFQRVKAEDGPPTFMAVVGIAGKKVVQIMKSDEEVQTLPAQITGDQMVIADHISSSYNSWWKWAPKSSYYLLSLKDGARRIIKKEDFVLNNFSFSPGGKYLVYYDRETETYDSYNLDTYEIHNITKYIPTKICKEYQRGLIPFAVSKVAGWQEGDSAVLLYDNYDLWLVDLSGSKSPVNVTNGYGLRHHIKLRWIYGEDNDQPIARIFEKKDTLLLTAFNNINKYNGFYQKKMGQSGDPELLIMGPFTTFRTDSQKPHYMSFSDGMRPVKAVAANKWIVQRQTAKEAPNYFITQDFKSLIAISNFQPQANYEWLTTELLTWKQLDGTVSQGVLYKPENFDPNKNYPVIIHYYEKCSHRLYEFPYPEYTKADINIPWFVSQGYLVFTPDIFYKSANASNKTYGEYTYNSVISAVKYLTKLPFVNGQKIGIQGHSFGGCETNYLVTHTHLFAAAAEAAGDSDPIGAYLTLVPLNSGSIEYSEKQVTAENGQYRYGATPWQRPDLYQRNSAVLHAGQVTTPLLIMHNEKDNQIQWRQGVEIFMALWRLGRKVWMLQYDDGTHGVFGKDAVDYTIRLTQFFNYYLKDDLPPKWMTEGVPVRLKGINTGFDFDYSGNK